jgi:hypothetical protein
MLGAVLLCQAVLSRSWLAAASGGGDAGGGKPEREVPDLSLDFGSSDSSAASSSSSSDTSADTAGIHPLRFAPRPPAFWDIVAPISEKAFFEEYWDRRPLHVARGRPRANQADQPQTKKRVTATVPPPAELQDLLKTSTVHYLLRSSPTLQMYMRKGGATARRSGSVPIVVVHDGGLRTTRLGGGAAGAAGAAGGPPPPPSPPTPECLYEPYLAGETVKVETAELWWEPYAHLCRAVSAYYDYEFTVTLYFTPAGAPIFAPQTVSNDLFVIQLGGSSQWTLAPPAADARRPYAEHVQAPGSSTAAEALQNETAISLSSLTEGDLQFVPRGWVFTSTALPDRHSQFLMLTANSPRFSHGRLLLILFKTLSKAAEADTKLPADSPERATSSFTRTQQDTLRQGLITQFIETLISEGSQDWIRQPLPLGVSAGGEGMNSLVGALRQTLTQLQSTMRERAPACDRGTGGCAGSIDTLQGNMPMLSGLVKYVYKAVYEKALTGRKEMLRRQSAQHRKWKAEASLCSPLESSNSSAGLHTSDRGQLVAMDTLIKLRPGAGDSRELLASAGVDEPVAELVRAGVAFPPLPSPLPVTMRVSRIGLLCDVCSARH